MFDLKYKILNILVKPHTIKRLNNKLDEYDIDAIQREVNTLVRESQVDITVRNKGTYQEHIVYTSNKGHQYHICEQCGEPKSILIGNMLCIKCSIEAANSHYSANAALLIEHLQNLNNNYKQQIYELERELYLYKNGMK